MLERLSAEINKALQAPDLRERYVAPDLESVSSTPDETTAFLKSEHARYSAIATQANIKLDSLRRSPHFPRDFEHELELAALVVAADLVAVMGAREPALRAQAQVLERDVLRRRVDPAL